MTVTRQRESHTGFPFITFYIFPGGMISMEVKYTLLNEVISMDGFDYSKYRADEISVLTPRLEALGYTHIQWGDGERDSFGPLTRVCAAFNSDMIACNFFYG